MNAAQNDLHVSGLSLTLKGGVSPVTDVTFSVRAGSIFALLGPSGCGKTTTLRILAGLTTPSRGIVRIGDEVLTNASAVVPPERRGVGLVFQDFALFPHLDVRQNIGFGVPRGADHAERVDALLALIQLQHRANAKPDALSGGEQQRVALARALAPAPRILLLDEPFANLDPSLRDTVRDDVERILRAAGTTTILVTHDRGEALALADEVGVMQRGRLVEQGTPTAIYCRPQTVAAALLVGDGAMYDAVADGQGATLGEGIHVSLSSSQDGQGQVLLRPEWLALDEKGQDGTLTHRRFLGDRTRVVVEWPGLPAFLVDVRPDEGAPPPPGTRVGIRVRAPVPWFSTTP